MKKKWLIIIPILLVLLTIGFFVGKKLYWDYRIKHAIIHVELRTNTLEIYEPNSRIDYLISEINGKLTTHPKVDTTKLGKQEITFEYINEENLPLKYTVEVEVVDTTSPFIFQGKTKTITEGYDSDLAKDLFCGDNYDPNPVCTIEGDYDVNTPGTYNVVFTGTDSSGNQSSNAFTLIVRRKTNSSSNGGGSGEYTDFQEVRQKYQEENAHFGIDVSHWQGDINFQRVKEAGVEFAYIRVGRGDGIGKEYVEDKKFLQNIQGFNEVGIPVGIYFYSNANSRKDAEQEAKWMIKKIKDYQVDLEIVYDWENWGDFQYYDLSFYELKQSFQSFQKTVEKAGYKAMLYGSKSYLESVWDSPSAVWVAHYTERTNYLGNYKVWQLCDDGKVAGINGYVDLDILYGDLKAQ